MQEIEVKAKIHDVQIMRQALERLGVTLSEPVTQNDIVFQSAFSPVGPMEKRPVLRIREQGNVVLFTVKISQSNELDSIEHEVEVSDAKEMHKLLLSLGFTEAVRVKKTRQKAKYQAYEICVDDVEHLGHYIEVEKLAEKADGGKVQDELFRFLKSFGINPADRVQQVYDTLMEKKLSKGLQ